MVDDRILNLPLNGKSREGIVFLIFRIIWCCCMRNYGEVKLKMKEVGKLCKGIRRVLKCRPLAINVNKRLYEGIMRPTSLYMDTNLE